MSLPLNRLTWWLCAWGLLVCFLFPETGHGQDGSKLENFQFPATNGKPISSTPFTSYPIALAFSPDEKYLAIALGDGDGPGGAG
jgi:hypothetical protein